MQTKSTFSPEDWAQKALEAILKMADKAVGIEPGTEKQDRWVERKTVKWNL